MTTIDKILENEVRLRQEMFLALTPRERGMWGMRNGFGIDGATHTLEEVGEVFGVSRERVRQVVDKADCRIKENFWSVIERISLEKHLGNLEEDYIIYNGKKIPWPPLRP